MTHTPLHKDFPQTSYKKLLYQARYRGSKEADYLFESFVQSNKNSLSTDDIDVLLMLFQNDDPYIFDWIWQLAPLPPEYASDIFLRFKAYVISMSTPPSPF